MTITAASLDRTLRMLDSAETDIIGEAIAAVAEVGRFHVEKVRSGEESSWMDVSGDLRSSVGGVVCRKGRIVETFGFDTVLGGSNGSSIGRDVARRIAAEYAQYDFVLIIVAGMDYAVYVEAKEDKVVLSAAYLKIERELPVILRERIAKVLKRYENGY